MHAYRPMGLDLFLEGKTYLEVFLPAVVGRSINRANEWRHFAGAEADSSGQDRMGRMSM
jgi:hypothetical protein